jgi:hypothetical protein
LKKEADFLRRENIMLANVLSPMMRKYAREFELMLQLMYETQLLSVTAKNSNMPEDLLDDVTDDADLSFCLRLLQRGIAQAASANDCAIRFADDGKLSEAGGIIGCQNVLEPACCLRMAAWLAVTDVSGHIRIVMDVGKKSEIVPCHAAQAKPCYFNAVSTCDQCHDRYKSESQPSCKRQASSPAG